MVRNTESDVNYIDREYARRLDEDPQLASEQCRGFLIAVWDNLTVQIRRERPELSGRPLMIAVARRLYESDPGAQALLDIAEANDSQSQGKRI
jgi:hypothetical protein